MVDLAGYEIAEQIYAGSRTAVYRALRQSDRQRVVIKQLYNFFNLLFQKFIEVFSIADHPLILFLDDLQLVDLASLQLLKLNLC
jgi:predicted ATPase